MTNTVRELWPGVTIDLCKVRSIVLAPPIICGDKEYQQRVVVDLNYILEPATREQYEAIRDMWIEACEPMRRAEAEAMDQR